MRARRGSTDATIEVEPENVDAVRLFFALGTQWHRVSHSFAVGKQNYTAVIRTGLDYGAAVPVAAVLKIGLSEDLLAQLRTLESETLAIDAEQRKRLPG